MSCRDQAFFSITTGFHDKIASQNSQTKSQAWNGDIMSQLQLDRLTNNWAYFTLTESPQGNSKLKNSHNRVFPLHVRACVRVFQGERE